MIKIQHWSLVVSLLLMSACGGGGDSKTPVGGTTPTSITLSGTVTFTSYSLDSTNGLDYSSTKEKPIRGAIVELQNMTGTALDATNSNGSGGYSLTAPVNSTVRIVVKAALGRPASPDTKIVDNTNDAALYAMTRDVSTGTSDVTQNINASSGWDGSNYSGTRTAAPFAILDVIYLAQQMVLSADSRITFPLLRVNWSVNNKPTPGDKAAGEIGTSHFDLDSGQLYILGAEGIDTDEYDTHVIAHEWGHYFEANFSRSDSIGGDHGLGDILDPTVAFGEGFGNALAGMVMNDPLYIDTSGISQAGVGVDMNLESDSMPDTEVHSRVGNFLDGFYSESSVQEVLYDLYDSGPSDDDSIGLGFAPIYDVMVKGQKNTPAFTSIFSFLYYLKQANLASSSVIASLAAAENIGNGDEYEADNRPIYTDVFFDGSVVTSDVDDYLLQTWEIFGDISENNPGNKLYNRIYFKNKALSAGCYTLKVTPLVGGDIVIFGPGSEPVDKFFGGYAETISGKFDLDEEGVFAVGSLGADPATFTAQLSLTPSACL